MYIFCLLGKNVNVNSMM